MDGTVSVAANLAAVRERIADAARSVGSDPAAVTLVGATKTVSARLIAEALDAGLTDIGENRAQELRAKAPLLAARVEPFRWHFLGQLQRNKVRAIASWVELWQTLDRPELADTIAGHASGARVLVQVNLGDEPQKGGCAPVAVARLVDHARSLGLAVDGLMTVPPARVDPRPFFARLRAMADELGLSQLSMGMTADFEVAIEEGATIVRVGRAIFGDRPIPAP